MLSRALFFASALSLAVAAADSRALAMTAESAIAEARTRALQESPWLSPQWKRLLHIRPNALGLPRSQVKGAEFFLSPDGFKNPEAELLATLEAFFSPAIAADNQHALCRFPARRRWLTKTLGLPSEAFPRPKCSLYDRYLRLLDPDSISVVFSSYYSSHPSSVYGHTLFRVNRKTRNGQRNELLDWGIGYAAAVDTANPVVYAVNGIFGGFKGTFTNAPYYFKVREYNDAEARDLWSYDLNLTPEQRDFLIDHLWEVGGSHFDYYFFTQNCGFHILTVIDAAVPEVSLADRIPLWVIPADSVKTIMQSSGLVSSISYRPSGLAKFQERHRRLNDEEHSVFDAWVEDADPARLNGPSLSPSSRVRVVDTAIEYFDFSHAQEVLSQEPSVLAERHRLLSLRSTLPGTSEEITVPQPAEGRPDEGHSSMRLTLAGGDAKRAGAARDGVAELHLRFALHDPLDPRRGYPRGGWIDMMSFIGRFERVADRDELALDLARFFEVGTFEPRTRLVPRVSWRAKVEGARLRDRRCDRCFAGNIGGGGGLTFSWLDERLLTYGLLELSLANAGEFDVPSRTLATAGPALGFFWLPRTSMGLSMEARRNAALGWSGGDPWWEGLLRARWSPDGRWAAGVEHRRFDDNDESLAQLFFYF